MSAGIHLVGSEGEGKSSVGNMLLKKESFKHGDDSDGITKKVSSDSNGEIKVFDCPGFGNRNGTDEATVLSIVENIRNNQVNAIFLVFNYTVPRVRGETKEFISLICKMFVGKYIWKHIGIIFTHCGSQRDPLTRESFVKRILEIANQEYDKIISRQSSQKPEKKTQDPNERLVDNLPCYFVNAKWNNGRYDRETLKQRKLIIQKAQRCSPITEVSSRIFLREEIIKNITKPIKEEIVKEDEGFTGSLKRGACHVLAAASTPITLAEGIVAGVVGIPFAAEGVDSALEQADELLSYTFGDYHVHEGISKEVGYKYYKKVTMATYDLKKSYYAGLKKPIEEKLNETTKEYKFLLE